MRLKWVVGVVAVLLGCGDDAGDEANPRPGLDGGADARTPDGSTIDAARGPDAAAPSLAWAPCERAMECARLEVPLDHAHPESGSLQLALARVRARGARIGSLVFNPGGPGSSGVGALPELVAILSDAILDRFDIVAFDPRGVGASNPIDCHSHLQELYATDPSPDDEREWTAVDAVSAKFVEECATKYGGLLPFLGTLDVVRDMDLIRAALGEPRLSYLGFSYGATLGAWYAELFPSNTRVLALDGPVDLTLGAVDKLRKQAEGFEQSLTAYFAWCAQLAGRCPWAGALTPAAAFAALAAQVEVAPLPSLNPNADRPAGPGEFIQGVIALLYFGQEGWSVLSEDLQAAVDGDGSALVIDTDLYLERDLLGDGSYANITEVYNAVSCLDAPALTLAEVRGQEAAFRAAAPTFGLSLLTGALLCTHWPVAGVAREAPRGAGAPTALVIGTTGDPATPYAGAQAMAARLSARLLTLEGEGHLAYGREDERAVPCIEDAVDRYLLDAVLPPEGTRCSAPAKRVVGELLRKPLGPLWR